MLNKKIKSKKQIKIKSGTRMTHIDCEFRIFNFGFKSKNKKRSAEDTEKSDYRGQSKYGYCKTKSKVNQKRNTSNLRY